MKKVIVLAVSMAALSAALIPTVAGASSRANRDIALLRAAGVTPALQARAVRAVRLANSEGKSSVARLLTRIVRLERKPSTRPYGVALAYASLAGVTEESVNTGDFSAEPDTSNPGCWSVPYKDRVRYQWNDNGVLIGYINEYHGSEYCGNNHQFIQGLGGSFDPLAFGWQSGTPNPPGSSSSPFCFVASGWSSDTEYANESTGQWAFQWHQGTFGFYEGRTCVYYDQRRADLNISSWGTANGSGTG